MGNDAKNKTIKRIQRRIFNNWNLFSYFLLIWVIVAIPAAYLFEREGILLLIFGLIAITLSWLMIDVRFETAQRNPSSFLKSENINETISKIHWRLIYPATVILVLVYYLLPISYPNIAQMIALVSLPTLIIFGFIFIGTTIYQIAIIGNVKRQPALLRLRASAYFTLTASLLKNSTFSKHGRIVTRLQGILLNRKSGEIERRKKLVKMFENGMHYLNAYFMYKYDAEFANFRKYIDYFHYELCFNSCVELDRLKRQ